MGQLCKHILTIHAIPITYPYYYIDIIYKSLQCNAYFTSFLTPPDYNVHFHMLYLQILNGDQRVPQMQ